jgi:hypothetical protein
MFAKFKSFQCRAPKKIFIEYNIKVIEYNIKEAVF